MWVKWTNICNMQQCLSYSKYYIKVSNYYNDSSILDPDVRERLSEELTFKLRSECHKVTSHVNILGKGIPGTEKS